MHINYGKSDFKVIEEMVNLLYDVVLELLPKVWVITIGQKEEEVGSRYIPFLKDGSFLDGCEVLIDDSFHAFVKERIVGGQELFVGGVAVDYLGADWFSSHKYQWIILSSEHGNRT